MKHESDILAMNTLLQKDFGAIKNPAANYRELQKLYLRRNL